MGEENRDTSILRHSLVIVEIVAGSDPRPASQMKKLTATLCLTLALLLGSAGMSFSADFEKGLTAAQKGDFATALREWTPLAKQGDTDAQFNLGIMYDNGQGVPQDDKIAVKWYRLAAEQGFTYQSSLYLASIF